MGVYAFTPLVSTHHTYGASAGLPVSPLIYCDWLQAQQCLPAMHETLLAIRCRECPALSSAPAPTLMGLKTLPLITPMTASGAIFSRWLKVIIASINSQTYLY